MMFIVIIHYTLTFTHYQSPSQTVTVFTSLYGLTNQMVVHVAVTPEYIQDLNEASWVATLQA